MRLDGWKAIGAHFGRERSTVIRWEADRGMPVHRIPGKGRGSVFALTEELDAWLAENPETEAEPQEATPPAAAPSPAPSARKGPLRLALSLAAMLGVISLGAFAFSQGRTPEAPSSLPDDPALASIYLEARSDWARRSEASITAAIAKLTQVTDGDPGFAPAHAALADSYILAREFGSMSDPVAFGRAQQAADAALRINPEDPDALRALGFIEYWWRGNRQEAMRRFTAAIAAAPQSAQTHFWLGNILIDNGDFDEGLKALERARLLEPASVPILVDLAWAQYARGEVDEAQRRLEALRQRDPELATARDYLSIVYLEQGNIAGFVEEYAAHARIRKLEREAAHAEAMTAALAQGQTAVLPVLVRAMETEIATGERSFLPWPTMIAAAADDRAATLRLLGKAVARNETWGSAWAIRYLSQRWRGDREITALIGKLRPPSMARN
ncbi:tetratricopeptide repeat protein [Porphyrobacter sp. YT40]|uniref:tetratricopeptide repeat protein n=1 Tax=Porphyrobacter sp. YT40 TaxID=2547601 RepID=UPI001142D965|nr:tetratricopeptide repeat protein [Porphyrobacter sp. YT40]QDH33821.1 tetratricopeptide repeat protein [Porphyrobacter sp. YT40]